MATEQQIDETLDMLRALWKRYPTLRFCQLVSNATQPGSAAEFFYCEDEKLREALKNYAPTKASSL